VHVAGFANKEIIISYASKSATSHCPDKTLRISTEFNTVDVIDFGFTAFGVHHSYDVPTIRDFMVENGICTLEGLVAAGYPYLDEGLPNPVPESAVDNPPVHFYSNSTVSYFGETIEDYTQESADADSLCFALDGARLDDTCRACEGPILFVAAASDDWCLKQIGGVFYRDECTNVTGVGTTGEFGYTSSVGQYDQNGYDSIIRSAPLVGGGRLVQLDDVSVSFLPVVQNPPSKIGLRVGASAQISDPNTDLGLIVWHQHSLIDLKTISPKTAEQHRKSNTIPAETPHWPIFRKGKILYVELKVSGVGGDAEFSSMAGTAKLAEVVRY
jgi:hypothetical protein